MKVLFRPEFLFVLSAVAVFLTGLPYEALIDVNVHDTYYVIPNWHITSTIAAGLLFISFVYFIFRRTNRPLINSLAVTHWLLTILPYIACCVLVSQKYPRSENMSEEMTTLGKINAIISIAVLFALIGQLLFIVNIVIRLIRGKIV